MKRDRRLLVLQRLVTAIPAAEELDEFDVNNRLRPFSDDVATLRRLLVDEGLLERPAPGHYRRQRSGEVRILEEGSSGCS